MLKNRKKITPRQVIISKTKDLQPMTPTIMEKIKTYQLVEPLKVIGLVAILCITIPVTSWADFTSDGEDASSEPVYKVNGKEVTKEKYETELDNCTNNCKQTEQTKDRKGELGGISGEDGADAKYTEYNLTTSEIGEGTLPPPPSNNQNGGLIKETELSLLIPQTIDTTVDSTLIEVPLIFSLEADCMG